MFKKKTAQIDPQTREAHIEETAKKLRLQLMTLERKKEELFGKVLEARKKGLKTQEDQARGLMRRCMATHRQVSGMLMTLELAVEARDLSEISQKFLESIGMLSQDIVASASKSNAKKTEKEYLKAMYVAGQKSKELDHMLDMGEYSAIASVEGSQNTEYDSEIDSMIESAESGSRFSDTDGIRS